MKYKYRSRVNIRCRIFKIQVIQHSYMYLKTEGRPFLTEKQKKYENFGRKKLKSNVICQLQNGWKRIKTWMVKLFTKLIEITQKK